MKYKRILSLLLTSAMLVSGISAQTSEASSSDGSADEASIIELFQNPDTQAKGMFRYWIPDAAATYEQLEAEMTDMYEAGFGGVEIACFPAMVSYDNSEYGWATENWRNQMKNILKVAASFEEPFIVDFTISPGWPMAFNSIDPNDKSADKEVVYSTMKVTDPSAVTEIPMAVIATTDAVGTPFIIKNDLVGAVIGKVTEVGEDGSLTLDPASLQTLETTTTGKTTVAGIPSVEGLSEDSEEYQYVLSLYENEIPDTSLFFEDSAGNPIDLRTPLDDVQEYWQTDLSSVDFGDYAPSDGDAIAVGDYVLYGFYERGTGGTTLAMGLYAPMEKAVPGVAYETSPFSSASSDAVIAYLDEHIFCDEELVSLMKDASARIGGAIFEDSLENVYAEGIAWNDEYPEAFQEKMGYDAVLNLPFISGAAKSSEGDEASYQADYNSVISQMYQERHITPLQDYFNEKTGFSYRAQAYITRDGYTLDSSAASAQVDIAEGESLAFGSKYDNFRLIASGVHMADKDLVSSESFAIQRGISYNLTWDTVVKIMNGDFAAGVNRLIFHGYSLGKSNAASEESAAVANAWPGWSAFSFVCTEDWGERMPYWEDVHILSDYIARNQAVLQNGTPKIDLLVYDLNSYDPGHGSEEGDESAFHSLLDAGYSYDCVMTEGLLLENNTVTNGVLCADGPAYKAVIVNQLTSATEDAMEQLLSFAQAGLPVIFYQGVPETASNVQGSDEAIQNLTDEILATGNACVVTSQAEALRELSKYDIVPSASYIQQDLRTIMREDTDGSRYYYLYNNSDNAIDTDIDFEGNGNLYLMNAWDGTITPASGTETEDGIHTTIHLDAYDTVIAAVTENTADFPEAASEEASYQEATALTEGEAISLDSWNLSVESWGPDATSDGGTATSKTSIEVGDTSLLPWSELSVSQEQLDAAGVQSMADVSGIGYYETEVELSEVTGGRLEIQHGSDMITEIVVNGQAITDLDPTNTSYDLSGLLQEGTNTIQIKLATTLINRARVENTLLTDLAQTTYGITSATLIPYTTAS